MFCLHSWCTLFGNKKLPDWLLICTSSICLSPYNEVFVFASDVTRVTHLAESGQAACEEVERLRGNGEREISSLSFPFLFFFPLSLSSFSFLFFFLLSLSSFPFLFPYPLSLSLLTFLFLFPLLLSSFSFLFPFSLSLSSFPFPFNFHLSLSCFSFLLSKISGQREIAGMSPVPELRITCPPQNA